MRQGAAITGFIDLALERAFLYREQAASEVVDMNDEDRAREVEARYSMLEKLADYDDALMEQLLEDRSPGRGHVFADLVTDMREGMICPVLIGSAEHGHGVGRLLKLIRHEAPGVGHTRARLGVKPDGDSIAQVLKTIHTLHAGKLSVARILSGSIADAAELTGPGGPAGRVSGIVRINGQQTTKRDAAGEGETVGLGKLDTAPTGATLTTGKMPTAQLVSITPPEPVLALAVRAAERKDEVKLSTALTKAIEEDPSLRITHAPETGETLIEGQGEMHLRVAVERIAGKYGVAVSTREPSVPYKETIKGSVSIRGRHKKQSGGHGQFGDVVLEIKALPRGAGFQFADTITGGVVPKNYIPSVEIGVGEYLKRGPLGFNVVDVGVTLTDGSYHTVDSSDMAFRTAAQIAMREGMVQCKPVLLEPVLKVEISVPSEATAKVNGIVSQRRGQILGFDSRPGWDGWDVVEAMIPEAEIRDLIVELRSATAGVGTFRKKFDHLAELTGRLATEAIEKHGAAAA
jgi:elongation factor G